MSHLRDSRTGGWYRALASLMALVLVPSLALPAPATQLSEDDREEVEQGREADPQIEAEFGFYDDAELQAYVDRIGNELAALSERPQLPWTFRILDSPVVNAFALPGGFIYVTRGLLAHMNSEAELAGVLGHEIGHVTGKHSQARQRRGFIGSLLTLGAIGATAIFSPDAAGFLLRSGLAQNVTGLFLLKYSRDQELDADERGIRYATAAGYDPRGIGAFFVTLQNLEEQTDRKGVPGWLSTHPQVDDRIQRSSAWADESLARFGLDPDELVQGRTPHLFAVDAIVFGENPREGYRRGDDFLHPDLEFALTFPSGWSVTNSKQSVTALDSARRAMVQLTLASGETASTAPGSYVRDYLRRIGARIESQGSTRVNDLEAYEALFAAQSNQTVYYVYGLWVLHDDLLYQMLGLTTPRYWRDYQGTLRASQRSFRRLTDPEALRVEPARVELLRVPQQMLLRGVVESEPRVSVQPETIALINQMSLDDSVAAGSLLKLVVGGPGGARSGAGPEEDTP